MVILRSSRRRTGALTTDLVVALAILAMAVLPMGVHFGRETAAARENYRRAVAMELVDAEIEILRAGEWKRLHEGTQEWNLDGRAAGNLPGSRLLAHRHDRSVRLEWFSRTNARLPQVIRKAVIP